MPLGTLLAAQLLALLLVGAEGGPGVLASGKVTIDGDAAKLAELMGLVEEFDFWFDIVTLARGGLQPESDDGRMTKVGRAGYRSPDKRIEPMCRISAACAQGMGSRASASTSVRGRQLSASSSGGDGA